MLNSPVKTSEEDPVTIASMSEVSGRHSASATAAPKGGADPRCRDVRHARAIVIGERLRKCVGSARRHARAGTRMIPRGSILDCRDAVIDRHLHDKTRGVREGAIAEIPIFRIIADLIEQR